MLFSDLFLFLLVFVAPSRSQNCYEAVRKTRTVVSSYYGGSSSSSAKSFSITIRNSVSSGPDRTIACDRYKMEFNNNKQSCSSGYTYNSKTIYLINCDPLDCTGSNCWFPPEKKDYSLITSKHNDSDKRYFKVTVYHSCDCDLIGCEGLASNRVEKAEKVSFSFGSTPPSCNFSNRSVLVKKSSSFVEAGSTNVSSQTSVSVDLQSYSLGEYDWKFQFSLNSKFFESSTRKLCVLGGISDLGLLSGSNILAISSTSSQSFKKYIVKSPFSVNLILPSACPSFSLTKSVQLSCSSKTCSSSGSCSFSNPQSIENCSYLQTLSLSGKSTSTSTSHVFYLVDFSLLGTSVESVASSSSIVYRTEVTTHSGGFGLVSESFSISGCSPLDDGSITSLSGKRFIRFKCSSNVSPQVTLRIGSFISDTLSITLPCFPSLVALSCSISAITSKLNESSYRYLVSVSSKFPVSCLSSVAVGFEISASGMSTISFDCASSFEVSIPKSISSVSICSFIRTSPISQNCLSKTLSSSTISLDSFVVSSSLVGFLNDPTKSFSVSLLVSGVSGVSVFVLVKKNNKDFVQIPLTRQGSSLTFLSSHSFPNEQSTYSAYVVVNGLKFDESSHLRSFSTESISSPSISSSPSESFGFSELDFKFSIFWGSDTSPRSLSVLFSCSDGSGTDSFTKSVEKSCTSCSLNDISLISLISLIDLGYGYLTVDAPILYCSFSADVSNGKYSSQLSRTFNLNASGCVEQLGTTITRPSVPQFISPTIRSSRCLSISASQTAILLKEDSATVHCLRTFTPTLCSITESFLFSQNGKDDSSSPNQSNHLLSFSSTTSSLSVVHKVGALSSDPSTLSGLSLCSSTPSLSPVIVSNSDVIFVNSTKFYPKTLSSSIVVSGGFSLDCSSSHQKLFSLETVIGSSSGSSEISLVPGSSSFSVSVSAVYCGSGHDSELTFSSSRTFTNCLSGLLSSPSTYLSFSSLNTFFASLGLFLPVSVLLTNESVCDLEISFKLSSGSNSFPLSSSPSSHFMIPLIHCSSFSSVQSFVLHLSLPDQTDSIEKSVDLHICKLVHPSLSGLAAVETVDHQNHVLISWSSIDGTLCSETCEFVLSLTGSHSGLIPPSDLSSRSYLLKSVNGSSLSTGDSLVIEFYSRCRESLTGTFDESSHLMLSRKLCFPSLPKIANFACSSCETVDGYLVSSQLSFSITFDIVSLGTVCSSTESNYVVFSFDGMSYVESFASQSVISFSLSFGLSIPHSDQLFVDDSLSSVLKLNSFEIKIPELSRCIVLEPNGKPEISGSSYIYLKYSGVELVHSIHFDGISNLYSPCFSGGRYRLEFFTYDDRTPRYYSENDSIVEIVAIRDQFEFVFTFKISTFGVYYCQIVGLNGIDERSSSDVFVIHVCSSFDVIDSPTLISPLSTDVVSVLEPIFEWSLTSQTVSIKCGSGESVLLRLDICETEVYDSLVNKDEAFEISVSVSLFTSKFQLYSEHLLSLSTQYSWRLVVIYQESFSSTPIMKFSEVSSFVTVSRHCSYLDCHHGVCDDLSVTCVCHSGYRGEVCDRSGLSSGAYVGIILGILLFVLLLVIVAIFLLRKFSVFGLRLPDFTRFMFTLPKPSDFDSSSECVKVCVEDFEKSLFKDAYNSFAIGKDLCKRTAVTELDNTCRCLVYCYEKNGEGLNFIKELIEYEVCEATTSTTLFRNNSFSTKCFKVFCRLVGLPYLYRVLFPILDKLIKEEQREEAGVILEGDVSRFSGANIELDDLYELDPSNLESNTSALADGSVEKNCYGIQLLCSLFLSSLNRTAQFCPLEFRKLCFCVRKHVHKKFPEFKSELALSAFMFLRFFVAGLTVPESFGLISSPPSEKTRRTLILVSKVLSNLSTHVMFGVKEDYMEIMNEYLEEHKNSLDGYYSLLCTPVASNVKPVRIPEKHYELAIQYLFDLQNSNQTRKEEN